MVILGLDAAWTPHRASGVAIVTGEPADWQCLTAVSSYEALFHQSGAPDLLTAVEAIAGEPLTLASVDMPLATEAIVSRRICDNELTRAFVRFGCGVHSSTPDRPGAVSSQLMQTFSHAGYQLAVHGTPVRPRQVIEVYPHIAVMRLLNENYRVPYKIARAGKYWPDATPGERRTRIRANLGRILRALRKRIDNIPLKLPPKTAGPTEIKKFEDALDAVVCAWIGTRYIEGKCRSFGDETAAIWVPE